MPRSYSALLGLAMFFVSVIIESFSCKHFLLQESRQFSTCWKPFIKPRMFHIKPGEFVIQCIIVFLTVRPNFSRNCDVFSDMSRRQVFPP